MKAADIMTTGVEYIAANTSLVDAARRMKRLDTGFLPVCDNGRLAGTITDRDVVVRAIAEGRPLRTTPVHAIMTTSVFWCYEDQEIEQVAHQMQEKEVRRMLILNRENRLAGVISIGDMARAGGEEAITGETLRYLAQAPHLKAA